MVGRGSGFACGFALGLAFGLACAFTFGFAWVLSFGGAFVLPFGFDFDAQDKTNLNLTWLDCWNNCTHVVEYTTVAYVGDIKQLLVSFGW